MIHLTDLPNRPEKSRENELRAPIKNGHNVVFNGMAVAPELRVIKKEVEKLLHTYQQTVPGSEAASRFLLSISNECRELLKQMCLRGTQQDGYNVEFYSGTSRALEVAIARMQRPERIILSPFEHPSAIDVTRWYMAVAGSEIHQIQFKSEEYSYSWSEQEDRFIEGVLEAVTPSARHSVLILSEVCYATGMILPVARIVERIRQQCGDSRISIIIDGAHSIGNGYSPEILDHCDAYVFSGHKWLLAPDPCGIILSRLLLKDDPVPYDAWSRVLPSTTVNVRMIAGLCASLRILDKVGLGSLWAHSRELRRNFLERMNSTFEFVGADTGMDSTLMMAIRPKAGKKWKFDLSDLHAYLQRKSVHVLVLAIDPNAPWVRIAFHCFNEAHHLDRLCLVLEEAVDEC